MARMRRRLADAVAAGDPDPVNRYGEKIADKLAEAERRVEESLPPEARRGEAGPSRHLAAASSQGRAARPLTARPTVEHRTAEAATRAPVSGELSDQPIAENRWGMFDATAPVAYHADGPIGSAVRYMGEDARMDVDGEPLANVVGKVATDVVMGRRSAQEGVDAYKQLRDRLPENSRARYELDDAIRRIDAPTAPLPALPAGTPEPLRQLVADLHAVPIARGEPEKELDKVRQIADDLAAGRPVRPPLDVQLSWLTDARHESYGDSGKFEIDRAVQRAAQGLRNGRRSRPRERSVGLLGGEDGWVL